MVKNRYESLKLIEGFNEEKMSEYLNDGYEVVAFNSTTYGATQHFFLLGKVRPEPTPLKKSKKTS